MGQTIPALDAKSRQQRDILRAPRGAALADGGAVVGTMGYENLLVETRDGVAIVTVNRPAKLNALDARTIAELDAAFDALGADGGVRGVVLTGTGEKAFVAGADIEELSRLGPEEGRALAQRGRAAALFGELVGTEDAREGTRAFLERRPAQFKGR